MAGETDLGRMLATLSPRLLPGEYVFLSLADPDPELLASLEALATVREEEGLTVVAEAESARRAGLGNGGRFRCVTIGVHSSLHAVGLTAALSTALAEAGIPANMLAGARHDHVLVPADLAGQALAAIGSLRDGPAGD